LEREDKKFKAAIEVIRDNRERPMGKVDKRRNAMVYRPQGRDEEQKRSCGLLKKRRDKRMEERKK